VKLNNPVKFYIDLNDFSTKNTTEFIYGFGNRLKHMLGIEETDIQIDVSKIWVNPKTYQLFSDLALKALTKELKSKKIAKNNKKL